MRGALGVLEAAPSSHPSCCLCRTAQGQSKPSGLCRHVRSGLPLPFLSGVQWGAAQTPHWEGCCSLTRKKKGRGKERIPCQSLHPASPHCPNVTDLSKASVPPEPTLITHLLRKIFKIRHGTGRQPTDSAPEPFLASSRIPLALPAPDRRTGARAPGARAVGGWGAVGVGGCSLSERIG